jgi:hypothetical protein
MQIFIIFLLYTNKISENFFFVFWYTRNIHIRLADMWEGIELF